MKVQFDTTPEEEEILNAIKFHEKLKSKSNAIKFILKMYKEQMQ